MAEPPQQYFAHPERMTNDKFYIVCFIDYYPKWKARRVRVRGDMAKRHAKYSNNVAYIEDE